MADVAQIVLLKNKQEKTLLKLGSHDKTSFYANQNYAVWVETFPDIRWEYRSFSDIVLYDARKSSVLVISLKEYRVPIPK